MVIYLSFMSFMTSFTGSLTSFMASASARHEVVAIAVTRSSDPSGTLLRSSELPVSPPNIPDLPELASLRNFLPLYTTEYETN